MPSRSSEPADEALDWHRLDTWKTALMRPARGCLPFGVYHLPSTIAADMAQALRALPDDLLPRNDIATRDIAVHILKTAPRFLGCLDVRLTFPQREQVKAAVRIGEACMWTGPACERRLRSREELQVLREEVARNGSDGATRWIAAQSDATRVRRHVDSAPAAVMRPSSSQPSPEPTSPPPPSPPSPADDPMVKVAAHWAATRSDLRIALSKVSTPHWSRSQVGLSRHRADAFASALKALPPDLLLPEDILTRDIALDVLANAHRSRVLRQRAFTPDELGFLWDALRLGDACLQTLPSSSGMPRRASELHALRHLVRWAREGGDPRQRAAFVAALRAPSGKSGLQMVRWKDPVSDTRPLGALALPSPHLIRTLTERWGAPPDLRLETHALRIDDEAAFADALQVFGEVTLVPRRRPTSEEASRLAPHLSRLDTRQLPPDQAGEVSRMFPDVRTRSTR